MATLVELHQAIEHDLCERTNSLWSYVRERRHSLDSERGCRMIREGFDTAVKSVVATIEPIVQKLEATEELLRTCRKELKHSDDALAQQKVAVNKLRKENERLRTELNAIKLAGENNE